MKKLALIFFIVLTAGICKAQNLPTNPWNSIPDPDAPVTYTNPVIPGFYSDPSVCRAGDDYYLVTSTFEYFPGVPVFHSKDLVNWEQIGHCIHRKEQIPQNLNIFAPTIRYHEGIFYMITTNIGRGNFYVTAKNPAGPWSDPVWIDIAGIDPDLFFEDGNAYIISSTFELIQVDLSTGKLIGEKRKVWNGTGGRWAEAPHIYKKDGYYYLLAAEGGTEEAHSVTIARSHNIWGPYTDNPANPILAHANAAGQGNPIQGVGHADIVQAHDDSWWMVFHGYRDIVGYPIHHILGRETCLAPVVWPKGGWPVVNGNGVAQVNMTTPTLPLKPFPKKPSKIDFDKELGLEWNYIQPPNATNFQLNTKNGILSLKGSAETISKEYHPATFVGRRLINYNFTATTRMEFDPKKENEEAGLILLNNGSHFDIMVSTKNGKRYLVVKLQFGPTIYRSKEIPLDPGFVDLRIKGAKTDLTFSYSQNGGEFVEIEKASARFLSTETVGWFTGVYVGLYATGNGLESKTSADYDWFEYLEE